MKLIVLLETEDRVSSELVGVYLKKGGFMQDIYIYQSIELV